VCRTSFTNGLFTTLVARPANINVLRVSAAFSSDGEMVPTTAVFALPPARATAVRGW
jgi:hypothetical protein